MGKREKPDPLARLVGTDGKLDPLQAAATIRAMAGLGVMTMNRIQEPFIRIRNAQGRTPRRRILECGEKCLTADTLIDTELGPVALRELYEDASRFKVYAWDEERQCRVSAWASAPFIKPGGPHKCYRIELSNGRWIEGADRHRVLVDGNWCFLEELYGSLHGPRGSSSGLFLSVRASGELHLSETPSGFALSCLPGCSLCLHVAGAAKANKISQVVSLDVPRTPKYLEWNNVMHVYRFFDRLRETLLANPSVSFACSAFGLLPRRTSVFSSPTGPVGMQFSSGLISGEPFYPARIPAEFGSISPTKENQKYGPTHGAVNRNVSSDGPRNPIFRAASNLAQALRRTGGSIRPVRVKGELLVADDARGELGTNSWSSHDSSIHQHVEKSTPTIVAFYPIPKQEVYDFTVDWFHTYFAGGLIHHNTGKTRVGICEDLAHAMGFRPWLSETDPDYRIKIQVPNHGLVGCETMAQSVEAKIRPELEALIPAHCAPVWKNDTTGALKSVTLKYDYLGRSCGSIIHIRSYNQAADSFRGIDPHWNHWDEPPPRDILIASERGKVVTNAPSWFTMTPLKEAYIYDMFSLKAFNAGGSDQEIAVFHGSMWENCQDWCRDCDEYIAANDPVNLANPSDRRPVNRCPKCRQVMGFIPRAGIEEYLKLFTDPDELAAHIEGKYAHLSGLVYKELSRDQHIYPDFPIPPNWMRIEAVDPHDARPTRWLFAAVSPEDIQINGRSANRIYVYAYLLVSGTIEEIARKVKVKRAEHNYAEPAFVILDARYGARTTRTLESESSWEEDLAKAGIDRIRLSHSDPGDIALGHKRVKEYLAPHYSSVKGKAVAALMLAADGCKGDRSPVNDLFNYQWKPGTDKPEEAYKDFCDCVRYIALEQPVYEPPNEKMDLIAQLLAARNETDYSPLMYGLRSA